MGKIMATSLLSYVPTSFIGDKNPLKQFSAVDAIGTKVSTAIPIDFSSLTTDFDLLSHKDVAESSFKVRLVSILDMANGAPGERNQVIFEVTPTLNESRTVEYIPVQPIHMPGGIQVYKFTGSRTFELTAHFVSRNTADALLNMKNLQTLRSWTMPYFGNSDTKFKQPDNPKEKFNIKKTLIKDGTPKDIGGVNLLGAPPEVLYLYGYSPIDRTKSVDIAALNINRIPVVITGLSIGYPEEVDYIPTTLTPTSQTEAFPVKMDVTISLTETHSPVEYEQFKLSSFKSGTLQNF